MYDLFRNRKAEGNAQVDELLKRDLELIIDKNTLPVTGPKMTVESHQAKFLEIQEYLNGCMALYIAKGCNDPLPSDVNFWRHVEVASPAPPAFNPFSIPSTPPPPPPSWTWVIPFFFIPFPGNPLYFGI